MIDQLNMAREELNQEATRSVQFEANYKHLQSEYSKLLEAFDQLQSINVHKDTQKFTEDDEQKLLQFDVEDMQSYLSELRSERDILVQDIHILNRQKDQYHKDIYDMHCELEEYFFFI